MMTPRARKCLMDWKPINERLLSAQFEGKYTNLSIVVCYAPTNEAKDETKDQFYAALQKAKDEVPPHDVLVVLGDLNAQVGNVNTGIEDSVGKHGTGLLNGNGERLIQFARFNGMIVGG